MKSFKQFVEERESIDEFIDPVSLAAGAAVAHLAGKTARYMGKRSDIKHNASQKERDIKHKYGILHPIKRYKALKANKQHKERQLQNLSWAKS